MCWEAACVETCCTFWTIQSRVSYGSPKVSKHNVQHLTCDLLSAFPLGLSDHHQSLLRIALFGPLAFCVLICDHYLQYYLSSFFYLQNASAVLARSKSAQTYNVQVQYMPYYGQNRLPPNSFSHKGKSNLSPLIFCGISKPRDQEMLLGPWHTACLHALSEIARGVSLMMLFVRWKIPASFDRPSVKVRVLLSNSNNAW